jgi:hypothetical protein
MEVGRMFNGAQVRTQLETDLGASATDVRGEPSSYEVEVTVRVKIPQPHKDLARLTAINGHLPVLLPALSTLLEGAKISAQWDDLQHLKIQQLRRALNRFDNLLSRHNLYDCETLLELQHPETKRRALFLQADMDTDSDGSDSDRVPEIDGSSVTFQPFTSYRWPKKTDKPNSFIAPREAKLKQYDADLAKPGVSAERLKELKDASARIKSEISDLKKYSFLVAATDPFVVLPLSMFGKRTPFSVGIGDYCVVIHANALYPAIVGDAGPAYKTGEGSLRLCRQLNGRSSANNRPEDDLKVTYLIFPGSAEKTWEPPDLEKWRGRCETLLNEIGGYSGELFTWEDLTRTKSAPDAAPSTPTANPCFGE